MNTPDFAKLDIRVELFNPVFNSVKRERGQEIMVAAPLVDGQVLGASVVGGGPRHNDVALVTIFQAINGDWN